MFSFLRQLQDRASDPRAFEGSYRALMPLYGDASGWGVVARLCALTMPPPPERPPSAAEDSPPSSPRSPSPQSLAPEIEAERQRMLALELDDIPREQVSDYDAYSRLNILQSYAADPRAFDEYYRMVASRVGDERGLGVVARLLALAVLNEPLPPELVCTLICSIRT